jgi:2-keto-4-pentenoate hydratase/2-oxohepta-3-ene-1,7-dioic acid hydratase in catechol pathway
MRLVSFTDSTEDPPVTDRSECELPGTAKVARTGVVEGEEVVDLTDPLIGLPGDMRELLAQGASALTRAEAAAKSGARRSPLASVRLLAPVAEPAKVLAIGMNYRAHVAELGREPPEFQVWFNKQRTCVVGPGDGIEMPRVSEMLDYEGELAFVIGTRCRYVDRDSAPEVVAGFSIMNDVSVRDWQWRSPTWTMGKSFDTHGPLGPWLVTPDELGDPHDLRLRTWVNDELRQDGATADMIFSCWEMVEHLSEAFTLEPGDVISTGTPSGVGASFDPPKWMRIGDKVRVEIEGLGVLENTVVAHSDPQTSVV